MRTRCEVCGKISEMEKEDELCSICGGQLLRVPENYGQGEPRKETLKRYEDMKEGEV